LEAKFYAGDKGESMSVELWLQVMAGSSRPGFASSVMVGKPKNATNLPISAFGYKPKFDGAGSTSGAG
jgi:hypothetical protein